MKIFHGVTSIKKKYFANFYICKLYLMKSENHGLNIFYLTQKRENITASLIIRGWSGVPLMYIINLIH